MLWEVMRWEMYLRTDTPDPPAEPFKLNNNHRAYYARTIMENELDLGDIFNTRVTTGGL